MILLMKIGGLLNYGIEKVTELNHLVEYYAIIS